MSDFSLDELNQIASGANDPAQVPPSAKPVAPPTGSDFSLDQLNAVSNGTNKNVPTETNPFVSTFNQVGEYVQNLGSALGQGEDDVIKNRLYADVMLGKRTSADAKRLSNSNRLSAIRNQKLNVFEKTLKENEALDWLRPFGIDFVQGPIDAARSIPYMREIAVKSIGAATAGGAAGAGAAAIAGQLGPQIATAEEVVTIPAAATTGFTIAGKGAAWVEASRLMGGEIMATLADKGIPDDAARKYALAGGAISGAIEAVQLGDLLKIGKTSAKVALKSEPVKKTIKEFVKTYAKEVAQQTGEELGQELTSIVMETLSQAVEKGEFPTAKDFAAGVVRLWETGKAAVASTAVTVGGAKGAGKTVGSGGRLLNQAIQQPKGVPQALKNASNEFFGKPVEVDEADDRVKKAETAVQDALKEPDQTTNKVIHAREDLKIVKKQVAAEKRAEAFQQQLQEAKEAQTDKKLPEERAAEIQSKIKEAESKVVEGKTEVAQTRLEGKAVKINRKMRGLDPSSTSLNQLADDMADVNSQIKNLNEQLESFKAGDISFGEIEVGRSNFPRLQQNKIFNKALSNAVKQIKQAERSTQETIANNQKRLINLIKKSGVKDTKRFLTDIQKANTDERLQQAIDESNPRSTISKLRGQIDKEAKKEALQRVKKQLSRAKRKSIKDKSKLDNPNAQKTVDAIAALDKLSGPALERKVTDLQVAREALETGRQDTTAIDLDLLLANAVVSAKQGNAIDAANLAETLKNLIDGEIEAKIAKKLEAAERRSKIKDKVKTALDHMVDGESIGTDSFRNSERADALKERFVKLQSVGLSNSSWEGKLEIIFQYAPIKELDALLDELEVASFVRDADFAKMKEKVAFNDILQKKAGLKNHVEVVKALAKGSKKLKPVRFTGKDTKTGKFKAGDEISGITGNQAIKLLSQMRDKDARETLSKTHGFTFKSELDENSTEHALEAALSKEQLAFVDAHQEYHNDQSRFDELNEAVIEDTGFSMEKVDGYSGFLTRNIKGIDPDSIQEFRGNLMTRVQRPGSTVSRQKSNTAIKPDDFYTSTIRQINQVEQWKVWRERAKDLYSVFGDVDIKTFVEDRFGKDVHKSITQHVDDMSFGMTQRENQYLRFASKVMGNAATAFLGAKPEQILKQATGAINILVHVGPKAMMEGVTELTLHPKKAMKIIGSSKAVQLRYYDLIGNMIGANREITALDVDFRRFKDFLLLPLKYGDYFTMSAAYSVYVKELKETKNKDKAMKAFERAFNTTQSSNTTDQLSDLARTNSTKLITAFRQQPTRMVEFELTAYRRAAAQFKMGRTKEGIAQTANAMYTSAVIRAAQGAFAVVGAGATIISSMVLRGGRFDDDEFNREMSKILQDYLLGPVSGVPIVGDILSGGYMLGEGLVWDSGRHLYKPDLIPLQAVGDTFDLAKKIYGAFEEQDFSTETILDIVITAARSINLLTFGLPVEYPARKIKTAVEG